MSDENKVKPWIAVQFLAGVAAMCYFYPPMLGFVIGVGGMLLLNFVLYLFFLDVYRTFKD